jgi:hypothetical protein
MSEKATPRPDELTAAHAIVYKRFTPQDTRGRRLEDVSLADIPRDDPDSSTPEPASQLVVHKVFGLLERRA